MSFQPSARHLVSAHVLHAGDRFAYDDEPEDGIDDIDVSTGWDSSYGWLTWKATPGERVTATTLLSLGRVTRERDGYVQDTERPGMPDFISASDHRTFTFAGARHELAVRLTERALLEVGGEVKDVRAEYAYANAARTRVLPTADRITTRTDSVSVRLDRDGTETSAWLAARTRPADGVTAEVGVRYDRISHTGDADLAPRVLTAIALGPRTTLRGSWGRYYQSHGIHELQVGDGETTFSPSERADQVALGLDHTFADGLRLRLEAYHRDVADQRPRYLNIERQLQIFPEAEGDRTRIDPAEGRAQGVEVMVERRTGERFAWSAAYALSRAEDRIGGVWVPRLFDQRHAVSLHAAYRPSPRWRLSLGWTFHSGWATTPWTLDAQRLGDGSWYWSRTAGDLRSTRLPDYHRLDFRVTRDFVVGGRLLHLYLDVFNLYDRTNVSAYRYGGYVEGGRTFTTRHVGDELLPLLPTLGFRYEF